MNLRFMRPDTTSYLLEYEPVLVSPYINTCIFGIHSELRFKSATRDHTGKRITFVPSDGRQVSMPYFEEKSDGRSAFIQVSKATVIPSNELCWVSGKIKGVNITKQDPDSSFLFEGQPELNIELPDLKMNLINKSVQLPVYNDSDEDVMLRKGTQLGMLTELHQEQTITPDFICTNNVHCNSTETNGTSTIDQLPTKAQTLITNYTKQINDIPESQPANVPIEHTIELSDSVPVYEQPRRLPYSQREKIADVIRDLQDNNFIETSHSQYGSPVVPVVKRNGQIRLCCDYRKLNAKTIPRQFPLPRADELIDNMRGSSIYSVIDLKSGYFQISLKEEDREKTVFVLPWGKYQWKRMPQGLLGAPFTFAENIAKVFGDMTTFTSAYFDDIAIFSATKEEHLLHVEQVLNRLIKCNLRINMDKCQWFKEEVEFLGHSISKHGVKPLQSKIDDIVQFAQPQNVDELRRFLGLAGYYRKFVPDFANVVSPLNHLLKKNCKFIWTSHCTESFLTLKRILSSDVLLSFPDLDKPFILQTDASETAIGFVLGQEENGIIKPVKFGGRTLTPCEMNYSVTDKELLAIYYACKQTEVYILGHDFIVYSDHKPLIHLKSFRELVNRRFRWIQYLEEIQVKIRYVEGKDNVIADYLSRSIKHDSPWDVISCNSIELSQQLYTNSELSLLQHQDEDLSKLFQYFEHDSNTRNLNSIPRGYRQSIHRISVKDNVLVFNNHGNLIIVIPQGLRTEILQHSHCDWSSGHFGTFKTHRRVLERFWWPNLRSDVDTFISKCELCQKTITSGAKHGQMGVRSWPRRPMELVSIDFIVDLPITPRGHKHILVINDHFSKFLKCYPLKDRTAATTCKYLFDYCLTFGIPFKLYSDRDPAFEAELFQLLMKQFGVAKLRTSGYRPQANGLTEQSNSTIKNYLRKYLHSKESTQPDWDLWLRELCYAYNTSIHSSTGFSPAELMFGGRKLIVPIDVLYGSRFATHYTFENFKQELQQMYDLARDHMKLRQAKAASYLDSKRLNTELTQNEQVLIFDHKASKDKLGLRWKGPFTIVKCSHPCYQIHTPRGLQWLPRDRIRKVPPDFAVYQGEEDSDSDNSDSDNEEDDDDTDDSDDNEPAERNNADDGRSNARYNLRARPTQRIPFY